jgi:hypothetical protein
MKSSHLSSQLFKERCSCLVITVLLGLMVLIHPGRAFGTNDDDIASAVRYLIDSDKYIQSEVIQVHASGGI